MVKLTDINEYNWLDIARLSVSDEQKKYLDSPIGIIARGYVYRHCNCRVFGIEADGVPVGVALVRDFTEEPLGYDLQQFMIDRRYQNRGYGTQALRLILAALKDESRFDRVEVCVNKQAAQALRVYSKLGFKDSGYMDESLPNCINLVHTFTNV